jgi:hypothetical protein
MRLFVSILLALLVAICTIRARADEASERAEELFQRARKLMGENDFATACPLLEEAYDLDHGGGTLLALAICHEGAGKPATALREFKESLKIAVRTQRSDRVMLAESHVQELESKVPRIKVKLPSPEPRGFAVSIDGEVVEHASLVAGVPVDPGEHTLVARATGEKSWTRTLLVSSSVVVEIPGFRRASPARSKPTSSDKLSMTPAPSRALGWVLGGVAVAGLATGGVFGALAFDANDRSQNECKNDVCTQKGVDLNEDARRNALVSNVGFVVGGVALAGSLYFFLRSPGGPTSAKRPASFAISW